MFRSFLIYLSVIWNASCVSADVNKYVGVSTVEFIVKYGYPVETYPDVVTEDNYLLDIYRIPHGKLGKTEYSQNSVLLMHGSWGTSEDYVAMGPDEGLAFLLADRGYDVWLLNARGTIHSRKHLTLNPDLDADFWAFSWHEIGMYDLPAAYELIKKVTKRERLCYIGISEGTTVFYVSASTRPEYNRNVTIMIGLAPVAYQTNLYSPIVRFAARFEPILTPLAKMMGIYEAGLPLQIFQMIGRLFCLKEGFIQDVCVNLLFLVGGYDPMQFDKKVIPILLGIGISGSIRQFLHYAQNINSGLFRRYDFGREINLEKYGTPEPPSYNLSKITSPIALLYSDGDWLSHALDVERLCAEAANCVYRHKVTLPQFTHFDFLLARDVIDVVFKNIFCILEKYNNNNNITKNC